MTTFEIAGKLATYTVTPTSPTTADVECLEPFKVNRSTVVVSRFEGRYIAPDPENTRHPGPWFHQTNYGHRAIYEPSADNVRWGTPVTDNTQGKVRDDIEAAILPLYDDPAFIEAGMRNAYELAVDELTRKAQHNREEAARLLALAESTEELAAHITVSADALIGAGLDGRTPAQVIERCKVCTYNNDHTRCHDSRIAKATGQRADNMPRTLTALAIQASVQ